MPPPRPTTPLPLQYTQMHKENFSSDDGVHFFNLQLSQIVTTLNSLLGRGGPAILPSGIDVRGGRVSGLGAPTGPTDAVSAGHADTSFGYAAQQDQLDVGKPHALKGLSYAYGQTFANSQAISAIQATIGSLPTPPYAGGESFALFGLVIKMGHSGTIPDGPPGLTVTFAAPFPAGLVSAVAVDDFAAGGTRNISVVAGSSSASQIVLWSDGTGAGAYWIAVGY